MGTVIQAGHIFSGGTIVSIPPAGGDSTLYYLVSSHLPSDYAVYLYDKSGNELVRIPKPNDASDSWGNQIATNDTKIAITDNDGNGALYIYDMDGSNMVKVTSSDASGDDRFGSQLEINSTKIIVGAPYAGPIHQQGSVYVYDLDGTNEVKITASDGAYGDRFSTWGGLSVSESKIFVGSGDHDNKRGALYIYDMDGSNEVKVQSSDNAQNDEFGYIVVASETKVVATAAGSGAHGAAYIFDHDGTNEVKVEPSVDSRNNAFGGASAAINDTHIAIADRSFNGDKGAVYIYNIDGSNEVRIEHPSHFAAYDFFGYNLAMSSSKVFTCPPNDDDGGSSTGNVYEYNLDGTGERTLPTPSTFAAGSRFGQGLHIYDSSLVPSGPTFIAPLSTTTSYLALGDPHYKNSSNQSVGGVYIYNQSDMSAPVTILEGVMYSDSGINYGIHLGSSILLTDTHVIVGNAVNHMEDSIPFNSSGKTPRIMIWSLDDLSSPPTTIFHPDGSAASKFGSFEGQMLTMDDKLFVYGHSAGVSDYVIYVYDLTDLSVNPIEITPPNLSGWNIGSFGASFDIDPVSKKLYVGAWSSSIDGASYGTSGYQPGLVLVYDVSDLSSNINTSIAVVPTPSDIGIHGGFGSSIRYHSDKLFIGNMAQTPSGGPRVASLRVYDTSDLSLIQKFDEEYSGQYGSGTDFAKWPRSLDVSDNGVVIGAPRSSPNEDDYRTGEVFVIPMDSSGNLGTLTKLSNSGLSVAAGLAWPGTGGDKLGEHVSSFGDKIYATHKGSSGNNMKTVEWSWSNLSSNGSELSIVDPRSTFDTDSNAWYYYTGMGVSPVPSLPAFIAPQLLTTTSTRWMIVGAERDDDNGDSSGSVYVYDATDLSAQPTKLTAFDGTERDKFGNAVAANDDKIIVGAYRYGNDGNDYVGSVYVYDANDLTAQPTKLTAFDSSGNDEFGISVSATVDKIVVGAWRDGDNGNNSGSVYVYDANDLTAQPTKLTAFDGVGDDLFGNAVSVTADKIVVGAMYEGDGGWPGSGSVYVYDANDLTAQPTKLTPFDGAGRDRFGESVFATVDKIVVGAWRDDDNGNDSGSVYVYDLSDLSAQPTKLTAFDGAANHRFGYSVAATVDKIIVGAEQDDDNGSYSGSVYVYDANDLTAQPTKLTPFDGAEDDHFGYSLDAVSNTLLVGSFYDDGQGSSYIYDLDDLSAQPTKLTAFDGAASDFFGRSVALCVETTTIPLPAFIAPPAAAPSSSGLVSNKIFMWSSDAASYQGGVGRSDVGGLVMTDGDFSNPTTIQLDSPQMVVGGEGKVVTISQLGEIKVYDESTGQLEQTFNDSYLDSAKTTDIWGAANDAVIGAGKIFISSPEYNPQGIGSIIVVDLLDRNVDTYLITPTLGNYSRLSSVSYGGITFIDGRIYGHTSQWSSADQGIWHFAPDGSDEQFIPTPGATTGSTIVKWGDNFVVTKENTIQVIDSSGSVLHSVVKTYPAETYGFAQDFAVTSTGKLVVSNKIHYNPEEYSIFLYDEGLTNEIEFKPADIPNGIASKWGYGTTENSGGFEVFGEYILVSAKEADNNGITNCGAVYRYNDSGVLQDIFYGTVADQKIGTNISVGTALPSS